MSYTGLLLAFFIVLYGHVPPLTVVKHLSWDSRQNKPLVFDIFTSTVPLVCYLSLMICSEAMADWSLALLALLQHSLSQREFYPTRFPVERTRGSKCDYHKYYNMTAKEDPSQPSRLEVVSEADTGADNSEHIAKLADTEKLRDADSSPSNSSDHEMQEPQKEQQPEAAPGVKRKLL